MTQEKHQQLSKVSALPMTEPKLPKKVVVVTLLSSEEKKIQNLRETQKPRKCRMVENIDGDSLLFK